MSTNRNKNMLYATFVNFTEKPFTAYWNGKPYTFNPGQKKEHLPDGVAQVFAKHLANKVLTESKNKKDATYCSPKKPLQVPQFMNIFNKAYFPEGSPEELDPEIGVEPDKEPSMDIEVKKREIIDPYDASANPTVGPGGNAQVVGEVTGEDSGYEDPDKNVVDTVK